MHNKTKSLNGWLTKGMDTIAVRLEGVTQNIKELQSEQKELLFVQRTLQRLTPQHKTPTTSTSKKFKRGDIQHRVLASVSRLRKRQPTDIIARNLGLTPQNTYQALNRLVHLGEIKKHKTKDQPITWSRA